jgi:hypothetical protein
MTPFDLVTLGPAEESEFPREQFSMGTSAKRAAATDEDEIRSTGVQSPNVRSAAKFPEEFTLGGVVDPDGSSD